MSPTKPLLLTILERVELVLRNIVAGDTYNYSMSEKKVVRGLRPFGEAVVYPFDMVYMGADHKPIEYQPDHRVFRYPTVLVASYVDTEMGEPVTKMLKHLADVQLALETDLRSTDPASLGVLCDWGHLGAVATDEGELGLDGGAGFRLDINLCLIGDWGTF